MLRCTQCGSEDEFLVDEVLHHTILVQVGPLAYDYLVKETVDIHSSDWDWVECQACQQKMQAHEAQDAYADHDTPIPFTLVDPSVS